jgi:hypothetical protein
MSEFIGSVLPLRCKCAFHLKEKGYSLTGVSDPESRWYQGVIFGMVPIAPRGWRRADTFSYRYVGTLHEINSETATVALENVTSFGTEGRKSNSDEEIPPSDSVYEYIVFRGSDVKDLRIEEAPAAKENKPPQMPNDPAILGVS